MAGGWLLRRTCKYSIMFNYCRKPFYHVVNLFSLSQYCVCNPLSCNNDHFFTAALLRLKNQR